MPSWIPVTNGSSCSTLTEDGIVAFNELAGECFPPERVCPTGQLAIVLDSEVRSAPTVEAANFKREPRSRSPEPSPKRKPKNWPWSCAMARCPPHSISHRPKRLIPAELSSPPSTVGICTGAADVAWLGQPFLAR